MSGAVTHESALGLALRYRARRVTTPDGVTVAVQDWAHDGAPRKAELLLLHGFSQSHGAWLHQVTSPLAAEYRLVTYDLRGHGDSDKPTAAHFYREKERWADEVKAVIEQSGLQRPILVAWSYAGRVVLDYISVFGDSGISALVMANAMSNSDPKLMGPAVGLLGQMTSGNAAVALEGTKALLRASVANPLPPDEFDYMLRYNQSVPPTVRANLAGRPADYESVLHSLSVPTLVMQGMLDPITTTAMGAYTAQQVRGAELIRYDDLAHMPFWESPHRFNADLAQFVRRVSQDSTAATPETQGTRFAMLYMELRQIAQRELQRSGDNGALSPTTILHEAYLKLQQRPGAALPAQSEFLAYASRVMRNLVIDMVRRRQAIKRGGGFEITSLPNASPELSAEAAELESLGSAIDTLSAHDPALAELVDLKFFCGFSFVEIANLRGVSERTVQRDWEKARILLRTAFEDLKT